MPAKTEIATLSSDHRVEQLGRNIHIGTTRHFAPASLPISILHIPLAAAAQQERVHAVLHRPRGDVQRSVAPFVRPLNPRLVRQEHGDADVPRRSHQVEGGVPVVVADVGAGPDPHQEGCDLPVPSSRCEVQRGVAVVVCRVDVGAAFYLEDCCGSEPFHRRSVESGVALIIPGVRWNFLFIFGLAGTPLGKDRENRNHFIFNSAFLRGSSLAAFSVLAGN
ncbi:unnamed protein product [Clonostachys solani]|uniref:Uncharacterized protein n=1 Tax=Clonostachys solani TaxID=160281 RepID=A0A9N9YZG9_9HYPO|nr:unnamed protein product [Clonostachys solani]